QLKKLGGGDLHINAPLLVGADTGLIAFDGDVQINDVLRSSATNASIDFVGPGTLHLNGNIEIQDGQSLAIYFNGSLFNVAIDSPGQIISGNSTLSNDLLIATGGKVAPG